MNLDELQDFLDTAQIPEFKTKPKTFLEIARQPHYENVISNIYAFYLDPTEEHGLSDLFINSLVKCLNTKRGEDWIEDFTDFEVHTEYATKKGRIDILLLSGDSSIIIENKIYHHLNNDLREYSDYVRKEIDNKDAVYGIVLGLKEVNPKEDNFVSLTHKELLNKVFQHLGEYVLDASEKYVTFLKDFYQNIINLSEKTMKPQDLEFYLDHKEKISDIIKLNNNYKSYIKREIENACKITDGLSLVKLRKGNRENRLRYFQSEKIKDLYFTIEFSNLFTSKLSVYIIIELKSKTLRLLQSNFDKIEKTEIPKEVIVNEGIKDTGSSWYHFTSTEVSLSVDDVSNLSEFIANKLEDLKFLETFKYLENILVQNKQKELPN